MNTVIKAGAIGALALAGAAAHASIAQPSSGSSDAILFAEVLNAAGTAAVASYAGDTGVSINSLLSGVSGSTTYLGSDANLAKLFSADASGDSIQFAVLGGQYSTAATAGNFKTPGVAQFITTVTGNSTASLNNDVTGSLVKFAGINGDISAINTNAGGANTIEGGSPAGAGIWDVTNTLGLAYWDGGSTSNSDALGTKLNLYYVTAGAGGLSSTKVAYTLEGTASLSASGLTIASSGGNPPPVPLPAAVWLLGSGLLGLTGVARRKLKV